VGWFARVVVLPLVLGCGPRIVVPGEEGSGDAESSSPTGDDPGQPASPSDACTTVSVSECAAVARDTSHVIGETPIGNMRPDYAFFGANRSCENCLVPTNVFSVVMVLDPDDLALVPADGLVIELGGFVGPAGAEIDGIINAYIGGTTIGGAASVELESLPDAGALAAPFDPESPPIVRGNFRANDGDWATAGNFVAVYCPSLNQPLCG
jgi:hypothetical protein